MKNITIFLFFIVTLLAQNAWAQEAFVQVYFPDTVSQTGFTKWQTPISSTAQTYDGGYIAVGRITQKDPATTWAHQGLIMKVNKYGKREWFKSVIFPNQATGDIASFTKIVALSDNNFMLLGAYNDGTNNYNILRKINQNGNTLWDKQISLSSQYSEEQISFFISNDNHIIYLQKNRITKINANTSGVIWQKTSVKNNRGKACSNGFVITKTDSRLVRYNETGDSIQGIKSTSNLTLNFENPVIEQTNDGNLCIVARQHIQLASSSEHKMFLYRFRNDLSLIQKTLIIDQDSTELYLGTIYGTPSVSIAKHGGITILKNSVGNYQHKIWVCNKFGRVTRTNDDYIFPLSYNINSWWSHFDIVPTTDGGFVIPGMFPGSAGTNGWQAAMVKLDSLLQSSKKLPIKIYNDTNYNCTKDVNEAYKSPLALKLKLKSRESGQTLPVETDGQGNYWFNVNGQNFDIKRNPNYLWRVCTDSVNLSDLSGTADTLYLGIQAAQPCSALEVNIGNNRMRRCVGNTYDVQYYNSGTIAAPNAYIDFKLDDFLTFDSASVAAQPLGNNVFRFMVGRLESLESKQIKVYFTVNCTAVMGQMHCTEAVIRPYLECIGSRLWDGSQIQVTTECDPPNRKARFFIKNIGTGDMATSRHWGIIEDLIMGRDSLYFLRAGATDTIQIDSIDNAKIYRIIVEQDPNHPAATVATAVLWCANTINTHWQFVNQLAQDDGAVYTATNCTPNRDSYDPNEKSVTPAGVGEQHLIPKNTPLEYKIQFQNTGNDTAYLVRIHDQLSANLDWKTLKTGASSHPYTYTLDSTGLLVFTFANINLLDSTNHEPQSHGYVQFSIRQKKDLAVGTTLNNTASIYFDYNDPIQTNTVSQTIGAAWATIVQQPVPPTPPVVQPPSPLNVVLVYPNPFSETCYFTLKNEEGKTATTENAMLRISDITGRILVEKPFANGQARLEHSEIDLVTGILFYQISAQGRLFSVGKLLIRE
jgi:hypothetical protein